MPIKAKYRFFIIPLYLLYRQIRDQRRKTFFREPKHSEKCEDMTYNPRILFI